MTAVVEETEPESSFKETDKHWKKGKQGANGGHGRTPSSISRPSTVPEIESDNLPPDRDDDFSDDDEPEDKGSKNELQSFTFIPGQNPGDNKGHTFLAKSANNDVDMSKLCSVERIREYLEQELGPDLLMKVYPIITNFGDDILFMDKIQDLKHQLKHLLTGE